jgi:cholesterol oxidase
MAAMQKFAAAQNLPFARVPIAVTFEEFKDGVNEYGVPQRPCIACGDCAAGCNHGAKNTVNVNYLPDAKNHGAEIYTGITAHHVESKDGNWVLHCHAGHSTADIEITAEVVVLAAGTLGTNEILLRSRERGLPLSDHLGTRFSGNGDLVGWSYNTNETINAFGFGTRSPKGRAPVGPFASSVIDDREAHDYLIIEGTFPGGMVNGVALLLSMLNFQGEDMRPSRPFSAKVGEGLRVAASLVNPFGGAGLRTQTYLVVNQDSGDGRMFLEKDAVRSSWPDIGRAPVFEQSRATLRGAAKTLGGTFMTQLKGPKKDVQGLLTGHPSGGAYMADSAEIGVADHKGEVYRSTTGTETHKGLYVMDASLFPRCIGVNPLLTICAVAERCCDHLVKDRGWTS